MQDSPSIDRQTKLIKIEGIQKENLVMNIAGGTFYTVISFICLDFVFAISLHYISKNNSSKEVSGFGLAYTIINLLIIPISFGIFFLI
jgi:hypothetical protein